MGGRDRRGAQGRVRPRERTARAPAAELAAREGEQEHEEHAKNLERTRALAHDFVPPEGALEIEIFKADHTAWSKKRNEVIMMREAPEGHKKESFVFLSGTKVREMLSNGEDLPPEFARPEVAKILSDYYQALDSKAS